MKKLFWILGAVFVYRYLKNQGGAPMTNQTMRAGLQAANGNPSQMFAPSDAARSQG